ncbi:MAG: tripartite tricarboxylate transporter substrate binding protein [Betaproteobacteria bacterium]|nr:tripartite tricarboxylate transporter substrate binding protein [Betaproteobacteria bacterium]
MSTILSTGAVIAVGALVLAAPLSAANVAETYPSKPIRVIVGQGPGGATDLVARALAQKLSENLGQPIVVDNRTGAAGSIAATLAARATPDGYTALVVPRAYAISPSLYKKLPYDPLKDLQPVTQIAEAPSIVLVNPNVPARSVKELIELARAKPKELNFGSGGVGSASHLAAELFLSMAGIEIVHVPFKGTGPALAEAVAGRVQLVIGSIVSGLPHARSGRLRALAVTSIKRSPILPELPSVSEAGVPGYVYGNWYGMLVPAGTSRRLVVELHRETVKALNDAKLKALLAADGGEVVGSTPEQFGAFLRSEMLQSEKIIKSRGIHVK